MTLFKSLTINNFVPLFTFLHYKSEFFKLYILFIMLHKRFSYDDLLSSISDTLLLFGVVQVNISLKSIISRNLDLIGSNNRYSFSYLTLTEHILILPSSNTLTKKSFSNYFIVYLTSNLYFASAFVQYK